MCHSHDWFEVKRVYCPPKTGAEGSGLSEELAKGILWGLTSIELRCMYCNDVENRILVGDHRQKGDKL